MRSNAEGSNYEGAATLLVHGARVDLRNGRRKSALDLAKEVKVPGFLSLGHVFLVPLLRMRALEGDQEAMKELRAMVSAALGNRRAHSPRVAFRKVNLVQEGL